MRKARIDYKNLSPADKGIVHRAVVNRFLNRGCDGDAFTCDGVLQYLKETTAPAVFIDTNVVSLPAYCGRVHPTARSMAEENATSDPQQAAMHV